MGNFEGTASSGSMRSPFHPIGSYGFLSDCETGALLAPDGCVEWLCLPRFDSPSIFAALLDRAAGNFRLRPDEKVPVSRRYEPGTNVIETTWATETGWVVIRDALVIRMRPDPDKEGRERICAQHMLIRTARCAAGNCEVELLCDAAPDYAREEMTWTRDHGWSHATASVGDLDLVLSSDLDLHFEGNRLRAERGLIAGDACFAALAWEDGIEALPADHDEAEALLTQTVHAWRKWLGHGSFPDHPWRAELQRSALTLKGLIHAPSGGMVAALTTSLPETPGGERNWDYRYTWIRDATFALWALHVLGLDDEATDFMGFVERAARQDSSLHLQIMYGIDGRRKLVESTLDDLTGYEGARPVRIGNAAYDQRQNDLYGALLDSIYVHSRALNGISDSLWELVHVQVEAAMEIWEQPDQGIWEARGEPKHYVSSKLMCWVALDRGARLAAARGEDDLRARWGAEAERIRDDILAKGLTADGVMRQHYDTDALDASNLLAPLVRFLPADDERIRATVLSIADELSDHGLVMRYRTDETDDGLSGVEGTFSICSFWMVSALAEIGEHQRARTLCERLLGMGGALGLYAEEIEPRSGRQLGNFPQAFTHLALINAVSQVISDEIMGERDGNRAVFSEMGGANAAGPI